LNQNADHVSVSPASHECGFFFNTNGPPQRTNWHEMWQSATAIWGICGAKHQQGIAFTGQFFRALFVDLSISFEKLRWRIDMI